MKTDKPVEAAYPSKPKKLKHHPKVKRA